MSYLSVTKFNEHQHYKNRRPTWVKFYVSLVDPKHPLNRLPVPTRFLFDRMLLLAAEWDNAIPNDYELIAKLLGMDAEECREGIDQLLKGRWLSQTRTKRRASKRARGTASESAPPESESQSQTEKNPSSVQPASRDDAPPAEDFNFDGLTGIGDERYFAITQLLAAIGAHADPDTKKVIAFYGTSVPVGKLHQLREKILADHTIENRAGYVVGSLKNDANVIPIKKGAA